MEKRILLVDDESSLRRSLSISLSQYGYDVDPCENGFTALNRLELYKKNSVNLDTVVVDIDLPDINGIKLGRIIKTKYPETAMMYITGYADQMEMSELEELKSEGLLEKPFTADDLIARINEILEKHSKLIPSKVVKTKEEKISAGYALIKVNDDVDFFNLYRTLYFTDGVLYCDAVRGDIDIFLLIQSDNAVSCRGIFENQVKSLNGILNAEFLPVDVPLLNDNIKEIINTSGITLFEDTPGMSKERDSSKSVYSYVLLDVEREKVAQLYPVLRLTENVLYCDYTSGSYNMILMIYGSQFGEIDKVIHNRIVNMDGILKVKEYPIINIFEM